MTRVEAHAFLERHQFMPGRDRVSDGRFATPTGADDVAADLARRVREGLDKACQVLEAVDPGGYAELVAAGEAERAGPIAAPAEEPPQV